MPTASGFTQSKNLTDFSGFFFGTFFGHDTHWEKSRKQCQGILENAMPTRSGASFFKMLCKFFRSIRVRPDTLEYLLEVFM
jgi:hypothetical protein